MSSLSASVSVTTRALVNIFSRKLDHFQAKNELNVFHLFNDAVSPLGAALLDVIFADAIDIILCEFIVCQCFVKIDEIRVNKMKNDRGHVDHSDMTKRLNVLGRYVGSEARKRKAELDAQQKVENGKSKKKNT